jgi:site-specific DNA-methyltransferase (adenine-specific)
MKIEERLLVEIKPYGKNAKKHPEKQIASIAASIEEFGFNQPLVVDKDDILIVGHGRYLAAQYLGLEKVPVMKIDLDEEKIRAYRLADNKLNESDWDLSLVIQELKELSIPMLDLTGFDRKLVMDLDNKDDEVSTLPETPRSQVGDVYELGPNRIVCGDSMNEETYKILMREVKADMVFTDPPYNVDYHGRGKDTKGGIMNDKMSEASFREFLIPIFKQITKNIKAGGGLYVFHSSSSQAIFEDAMRFNGLVIKNQLIWNKPVASMGWGDYRWKHEPFFYACVKGGKTLFYGDRTNTTVLDFNKTDAEVIAWAKRQRDAEKNGKMTIWTMKREPLKDYVHPTQKPVELITYALFNSSKVEDIVLDPFLGSGSTLIACQKTNRICYGIELDPRFVDVIVKRWVDYTENRNIIKNGENINW